jgi:hypothetical protein
MGYVSAEGRRALRPAGVEPVGRLASVPLFLTPWRIGGLVSLHVQGWRKEQVRVERTRDGAEAQNNSEEAHEQGVGFEASAVVLRRRYECGVAGRGGRRRGAAGMRAAGVRQLGGRASADDRVAVEARRSAAPLPTSPVLHAVPSWQLFRTLSSSIRRTPPPNSMASTSTSNRNSDLRTPAQTPFNSFRISSRRTAKQMRLLCQRIWLSTRIFPSKF